MASNVENILQATIDGTDYTDKPTSRIEELLLELKDVIGSGGGGGSTGTLISMPYPYFFSPDSQYEKIIAKDISNENIEFTTTIDGLLRIEIYPMSTSSQGGDIKLTFIEGTLSKVMWESTVTSTTVFTLLVKKGLKFKFPGLNNAQMRVNISMFPMETANVYGKSE